MKTKSLSDSQQVLSGHDLVRVKQESIANATLVDARGHTAHDEGHAADANSDYHGSLDPRMPVKAEPQGKSPISYLRTLSQHIRQNYV